MNIKNLMKLVGGLKTSSPAPGPGPGPEPTSTMFSLFFNRQADSSRDISFEMQIATSEPNLSGTIHFMQLFDSEGTYMQDRTFTMTGTTSKWLFDYDEMQMDENQNLNGFIEISGPAMEKVTSIYIGGLTKCSRLRFNGMFSRLTRLDCSQWDFSSSRYSTPEPLTLDWSNLPLLDFIDFSYASFTYPSGSGTYADYLLNDLPRQDAARIFMTCLSDGEPSESAVNGAVAKGWDVYTGC